MKNSKWKNDSSEVHGLRSIPCIPLLSLFAGALAAAFTICINLEGEHSVHDLSTSSASLLSLLSATSLGDILMDIRIILIWDLYWKTSKIQPPSMTSWNTTYYGKEDKEDNQVFWKKVSHKKQILYTAFWGQGCKWRLYWQCRREGAHVAWNAKNAAQHLKPKQNNCSWNLSSSNPKDSWIEANWKTFEEQAGCICIYI